MPSQTTVDISAEYSVRIWSSSKCGELGEAEHVAVEAHPVVELALLDVADDVVDAAQPDGRARPASAGGPRSRSRARAARRRSGGGRRTCARCRRRCRSGRARSVAVVVGLGPRLADRPGAAGDGAARRRPSASSTSQARSCTPSPWRRTWSAIGESAVERAGDDEADVALLEHVAGLVAHAGLGPGVGGAAEAERRHEEAGRGAGVADPELDAVPPEEVGGRCIGLGEGHVPDRAPFRRSVQ